MASKLFFNGRSTSTPVVLSKVDDRAMAPRSLSTGNVLALVGRSTGGKPLTALRSSSPSNAEALVKGGELLTAAKKGHGPSAETNAPSEIVLIRVGQATQSSLTMAGTTGSAISAKSRDYGLPGNNIKLKVEAGTITGKRITAGLNGVTYGQDNLTRDLLTARYSGAGATATMQVLADGTGITLAVAGSAAVTAAFADYPTVQDVADRFASVSGMTVAVASGAGPRPSAGQFDSLAATDCKGADLTLRGELAACIDWMNGPACPILSATRAAPGAFPLALIGWTYLSGAVDPPPTLQDWQDAFTLLQGVDVQWVVPVTGNAAVHAMSDAHCLFMSDAGRKERRSVVGPALGTTQAATLPLTKALNSDRTEFVWPGHLDYDATGALVTLPSYMSAVLVAAGFAGLTPGETMTNKTLRVAGLEFSPRNPVDTDELIQGGVTPLEDTEDGFKVVRAVSTWLANDNYNRVEVSCGAATDFVARTVRRALEPLKGQPANPLTLARAASITETALRELQRQGIIVGDDNSPAYREIRAILVGDTISVEFQCSPVIPTNFLTVAIALVPYSGTAAA